MSGDLGSPRGLLRRDERDARAANAIEQVFTPPAANL
jgi:hypothetical protein